MDIINLQGPQVLLTINLRTKAVLSRKKILKTLFSQSLPLIEETLPKGNTEIGLHFCGERRIMSLNASYRNKETTTDVLSFPLYNSLHEFDFQKTPIINLGDIFICTTMAMRQAMKFDISLEQEILHLFVHGFLHLLGYDHEASPKDAQVMFDLEEQLVDKIYRVTKIGGKVYG